MWLAVRQRFRAFHEDLNLTQEQYEDGIGKAVRVTQALERAYNGCVADQPPLRIVGSWGKGTQVRPSADIDIMVEFAPAVFQRFEARVGNRQSQLLQEVKLRLSDSYPQTGMRGDGQVVVVGFNSITVEVVPVFNLPGGQYLMPDTNDGGRWKTVDPLAQIAMIEDVDKRTNGNSRALTKMIKTWKREKNVPLSHLLLNCLSQNSCALTPTRSRIITGTIGSCVTSSGRSSKGRIGPSDPRHRRRNLAGDRLASKGASCAG